MNKGILMSQGDVVGILNSDDFFASDDILEKVNGEFEKDSSLDGVYGDIRYVDSQDVTQTIRRYSSAKFRRKKLIFGLIPAHPSFYVKKECYEKFGLYSLDYKIAADYDMFVRMIWNGNIVTKYMPMTFVIMRYGGASSSGFKSHKTTMKEHLKSVKKNGVPTNFFLLSLRYFGKILELIKK